MNLFKGLIISFFLLIVTGCNDQEELKMGYQPGELLQAVEANKLEEVHDILKDTSYPINETNEKDESPLLIATHKNFIEIEKL